MNRWTLPVERERSREGTPRVFCERVRNALMEKGLGKHSFLKSAEEFENRGVNFVHFAAKNEKSEGAEIGRASRELDWKLDVQWKELLNERTYPPRRW